MAKVRKTIEPRQVLDIALKFIPEHRRYTDVESLDITLSAKPGDSLIHRIKTHKEEFDGSVDLLTLQQAEQLYDELCMVAELPNKRGMRRCVIRVRPKEIVLFNMSLIGDLKEPAELHAEWNGTADELEQLKREFAAYRNTAEEIHLAYQNTYNDCYTLEQALKDIAEQGVELSDIAVKALATVWTRRAERAKIAKDAGPHEITEMGTTPGEEQTPESDN